MREESIAIIGPGRMGIGIATAVLMANLGRAVTLIDLKEREPGKETEALDSARKEIQGNLELLKGLGALQGDIPSLMRDLTLAPILDDSLGECSLLFEALPEKVEIKQDFYRKIGPLIDTRAVVASATSTFHLDVFWDVCSTAGNILSAHWLNPAFLIPLVEVGYGHETLEWAPTKLCDFLRSIGKIPVKMKTSPGFIVPRIQAAAMNEAVRILEEGVTTAEEIDTAIKAGFGFRLGVMGLIEFIDLGGVDILYHAGEYLDRKLGGEHFKPPRLVVEKMERAEVGPRTGKGFYDYGGIDSRALFNEKYRGFLELLHLYRQSKSLTFSGGVSQKGSPESNANRNKRKEMP